VASIDAWRPAAGAKPGRANRNRRTTVIKMSSVFFVCATLVAFSGASFATEYEPDEGTEAHVPGVVHDILLLGPEEQVDPAMIRADLDYAAQMQQHHEGAVTMSQDYLGDPHGTNPILRKMARGIIANQRFEIALLEVIQRHAATEPATVLDLGAVRLVRRPAGIDGLEHQWGALKREPPGFLDLALAPGLESSERDVKFAKEMMLHHQGALDMAKRYNADPRATNLILKRLNLDIVADQSYEIGFLQQIVDRFPGDPDAVAIDEQIPGMEGMHDMGHGAGH
jgi:uncharacterized protein (DUF305 family)